MFTKFIETCCPEWPVSLALHMKLLHISFTIHYLKNTKGIITIICGTSCYVLFIVFLICEVLAVVRTFAFLPKMNTVFSATESTTTQKVIKIGWASRTETKCFREVDVDDENNKPSWRAVYCHIFTLSNVTMFFIVALIQIRVSSFLGQMQSWIDWVAQNETNPETVKTSLSDAWNYIGLMEGVMAPIFGYALDMFSRWFQKRFGVSLRSGNWWFLEIFEETEEYF